VTSIFKTPHGELNQFIQNLHSGGFTYEDLVRVNKKPQLAGWMHTAIQPNEYDAPPWWRTPDQQLERARELWPERVGTFPARPFQFTPRTETEVLLLHVPDDLDSLWSKIPLPDGVTRSTNSIKERVRTRVASNNLSLRKSVWIGFDPEYARGGRSYEVRSVVTGADAVFSALIQFPDWMLTWKEGSSLPILAEYRMRSRSDWDRAPYVHLSQNQLDVSSDRFGPKDQMAMPSVR
jgi:hypothetical protein